MTTLLVIAIVVLTGAVVALFGRVRALEERAPPAAVPEPPADLAARLRRLEAAERARSVYEVQKRSP